MQTNRKNSLKLNMLGISVATVLLTACGGSGGGTAEKPLSGKAVDFYLSGATVTFTDCSNATVTTDATGNFTAPAGCAQSAITVTGGTDIGTKRPFTGTLKAPRQSVASSQTVVVSPITTLIVANPALAATINTLLNLPAGYNVLTTDPMLNVEALKASIVIQTLLDKVAQSLSNASTVNGGTLTPQQASQAAIQALANAIGPNFDVTNLADIQAVVSSAATSVVTALNLPSGTTADTLAASAAPGITTQITVVKVAVSNIVLGATPADTLAALTAGGVITAVADAQASTSATLKDYVQLGNVSFNGGSPMTLAAVQASTAAAPISLSGAALSNIQISLTGKGTYANANKPVAVNAGFQYTVNRNTVNLTINNVQLVFGSTGALTAATVPAGSSYSYTLTGASKATATATNATADNLFSNGAVNLSINTFLTKLAGAAGSSVNVSAYAPVANVAISPTLTISPVANTALILGNTASALVSGSVTANVQ